MALGGTYQDHYKDLFKGIIGHEAQQNGSRLEQTVMIEMMEGNKTFFDKLGKSAHYIKTARNQDKTFSDLTFERRQVQEVLASFDHIFDREDLIKYVENPRNEVVRSAVMEMGRRKDEVIMAALQGNAVVTTNGSTANQALTLTIAVDDHQFDSDSGDVGLTTSKLRLAKTLIAESFGSQGLDGRTMCVAPSRQIMNLSTENQTVSSDFRTKQPLEGPGVVSGLSGYLGIDFIEYEETGTDGNSDEQAYVYTDDAVKMGVFIPLTVQVEKITTKTTNPDSLAVFEAIGATRMWEEKVVEIACDPLA